MDEKLIEKIRQTIEIYVGIDGELNGGAYLDDTRQAAEKIAEIFDAENAKLRQRLQELNYDLVESFRKSDALRTELHAKKQEYEMSLIDYAGKILEATDFICRRTEEALALRAELAAEREKHRLIHVEERLPGEQVKVLTLLDDEIIIDVIQDGAWYLRYGVTHWMPLPQPEE